MDIRRILNVKGKETKEWGIDYSMRHKTEQPCRPAGLFVRVSGIVKMISDGCQQRVHRQFKHITGNAVEFAFGDG